MATIPSMPAETLSIDRISQGFQPVCDVATGGWRRKRLAINLIELDCFFYDLAELCKHLPLVVAVTPTVYEARCAPHVTLVFF
jgi:hypothetical protein